LTMNLLERSKVLALGKLCEDEHLDKLQFKALIDAYIYSGREPIKMRFRVFRQQTQYSTSQSDWRSHNR
jgi:hypothetical protein